MTFKSRCVLPSFILYLQFCGLDCTLVGVLVDMHFCLVKRCVYSACVCVCVLCVETFHALLSEYFPIYYVCVRVCYSCVGSCLCCQQRAASLCSCWVHCRRGSFLHQNSGGPRQGDGRSQTVSSVVYQPLAVCVCVVSLHVKVWVAYNYPGFLGTGEEYLQ